MQSKDPWVVVSKFWPTYRVCRASNEAELLQSPYSTISLEGKIDGYETKKEAIISAISKRDYSCWFGGWDELHGLVDDDDDDDDDDDEDDVLSELEATLEEDPMGRTIPDADLHLLRPEVGHIGVMLRPVYISPQ